MKGRTGSSVVNHERTSSFAHSRRSQDYAPKWVGGGDRLSALRLSFFAMVEGLHDHSVLSSPRDGNSKAHPASFLLDGLTTTLSTKELVSIVCQIDGGLSPERSFIEIG